MWRQRQPGTRRAEVALRLLKTQPVHLWTCAGVLAFSHCEDAGHQFPSPEEVTEDKTKIRYQLVCQISTIPSASPDKTRLSSWLQKAWTRLTDASRKENVIKREPASLKSKCGQRLSPKQFILYFLGQTDTDFCTSMMLRRTAQNEGSDTIKAYLELWIQTMQPMATLSNVPLSHVFLL